MFLRRKKAVREKLTDPICGMELAEDTVRYKTEHRGQVHYFCSPRCKAEFKNNLRKGRNLTPKKSSKPRMGKRRSCH